jgi:glyoxylase-like metal-dependent hydrolase (beta-lactamase superfamily II)
MIHEVLPVGLLQCNCSVIGDEVSHEGIVIDPGDDISEIVKILERYALKVNMIVVTHAHIDHIGGAHKLRDLTGAPVYMHQDDSFLASSLEMQAGSVARLRKIQASILLRRKATPCTPAQSQPRFCTPRGTRRAASLCLSRMRKN